MLRKLTPQLIAPELMLVEAVPAENARVMRRAPGSSSWLPSFALNAGAIDTASWQTRAARGISWNRSGKLPQRRIAH